MIDSHFYSHTDLTLEIQEEMSGQETGKGYTSVSEEYYDHRIRENTITIRTAQAARQFGKFPGTYITLEGVDLSANDGGFHEEMSHCIARILSRLLGRSRKILIVGLGNRHITADALGPLVIDHLLITRPLFSVRMSSTEAQNALKETEQMRITSAIAPGVMAQTGMEAVEVLRGIVAQTTPEKIIVIDALAARNLERLGSTVQISSTGIAPGSGVGNRRKEISQATMGVPVIALGVPTVISIPSVASDILTACSTKLSEPARQELEDQLKKGTEDHYRLLSCVIDRRLFDFCMTPKDIDEAVKRISFTISEGINQAVTTFPY